MMHFTKFKNAKDLYGILDDDMWNLDETGFQIGVGGSQKIITVDPKRKNYVLDPDNRELVTALATIGGNGRKIPPFIIFTGAQFLAKYVVPGLEGLGVSFSSIGFTDDNIGMDYIKHFDRFTASQRVGRYRMLISDGHGSHETYEFRKYCWDNDIILFGFPPHSTHLLQF